MAVTAEQLERQSEQQGVTVRRRTEKRASDHRPEGRPLSGPVVSWVHIVTAAVVIFALGLGLVVTQTLIANHGYELALLRGELRDAQARTGHLETQVASLASSGRIADIAETELGMVPAEHTAREAPVEMAVLATASGASEDRAAAELAVGDGQSTRRVVLHLETTPREGNDGVSLADVGAWFLRWLRGAPPVRASSR